MGAGQFLKLTFKTQTQRSFETLPAFLEIPDANLTIHGS